jgi:hypothetical protein
MAGGYVVEALIVRSKTDTTYQLGILQAQAWCLLARFGAVLQRSRHDRPTILLRVLQTTCVHDINQV